MGFLLAQGNPAQAADGGELMQGNGVFSRSALRAALLTFGGSAPRRSRLPSAPTEAAAQTILSRLLTLQEGAVLERFAPLSASRGWRTGKYPERLF